MGEAAAAERARMARDEAPPGVVVLENDDDVVGSGRTKGRRRDGVDADGKRVRVKRGVSRKCKGMCFKGPSLPQTLLQQDAKERQERKRKRQREKDKAHKKAQKEKLRLERSKSSGGAGVSTSAATHEDSTPLQEDVPQSDKEEPFSEGHKVALDRMAMYLHAMGHAKPTPIQEKCWPLCLNGHDLQARAEPGSGKTFGYMFPLLYKLSSTDVAKNASGSSNDDRNGKPRALVLVPTRELAKQILATCQDLKRLTDQRGVALTGGLPRDEQVAILEDRCDVIIATPGRLCDLLGEGLVDLSQIQILVVDEADKMLQIGYREQLQKIQDRLGESSGAGSGRRLQTLLFSATFPNDLMERCQTWLRKERKIDLEGTIPSVSQKIKQMVHVCAEHKKGKKLLKYVTAVEQEAKEKGDRHRPKILVFVNTIKKAKYLAGFLKKSEIKVLMIHGKRSQQERNNAMKDFKGGKYNVLVATDVAARGVHIPHLKHVVLYDFPPTMEQYVHRIGRTGRQKEEGESFAFFTRNLSPMAPSLMHFLNKHSQEVDQHLKRLAEAVVEAEANAKTDEEDN